MPLEQRIRSHDADQLLEPLPPEDLAFDRLPSALVVPEQDSVLPELYSENPFSVRRYSTASCGRRLVRPTRIRSNNCHGWNCAFMFLWMRG